MVATPRLREKLRTPSPGSSLVHYFSVQGEMQKKRALVACRRSRAPCAVGKSFTSTRSRCRTFPFSPKRSDFHDSVLPFAPRGKRYA
jgi:hypothetical protein